MYLHSVLPSSSLTLQPLSFEAMCCCFLPRSANNRSRKCEFWREEVEERWGRGEGRKVIENSDLMTSELAISFEFHAFLDFKNVACGYLGSSPVLSLSGWLIAYNVYANHKWVCS